MREYSFYYRDRFCLTNVHPQGNDYRIKSGIGIIEKDKDGNIYYRVDGNLLNHNNIHPTIEFIDESDNRQEIQLHIRSWRNNGPKLKEVTQYGWWKSSKLHNILFRITSRFLGLGYSTVLLTKNGVTYYSDGYNLCCRSKESKWKLSKGPIIVNPIYHEMLVENNYGFIRSDKRIYFSQDGLHTWKIIYDGKRAIKDSMIWLPEEQTLLFSEYTPGQDFQRHHIYKFYPETGSIRTVLTFYTKKEHQEEGLSPYCRHIHCMQHDPYTGDIFVGVGDSDEESAIYRSTDRGETYEKVGSGSQNWRTLSFLFTSTHILWNTDSGRMPQYLHSIRRSQLCRLPIPESEIIHHPLINSASWNSFYDDTSGLFIMSASCEGCHYDKKNRVYGIRIVDGEPTAYSLFEDESKKGECVSKYNQLFVLGKDNKNKLWFYDTRRHYYRTFELNTNSN